MRIVGAVAGAVAALLLLVFIVGTFYRGPSHDNWDMATPIFVLAASIPVAIIGLAAGWSMVGSLQAGETNVVMGTLLRSAVLVAAFGFAIVYFDKLIPTPKFKPAGKREREAWAAAHTIQEDRGISLAGQLETAINDPFGGSVREHVLNGQSGITLRRSFLGFGADSLAAHGAYTLDDDGWRWDVVGDQPARVIVFPDPLSKREGPVFEVLSHLRLRRERRDAPAYVIRTRMPVFQAIADCLRDDARAAKQSGAWDGRPETAVAYFKTRTQRFDGCPSVIVPGEDSPWRPDAVKFEARSGQGSNFNWVSLQISPGVRGSELPFEITFALGSNSWYMIDGEGNWHMRNDGFPTREDPPPPPCLRDASIPCDEAMLANWSSSRSS